ncbi:MAG: glycosyltransferase family 2 protein [Candidatus Aenigmarchaeota archaeon]|nr:glycosyltransferase family 2 protein [Candidatus Aenigmarchaeota archaeon]
MKIVAVIPTKDEEEGIRHVLRELKPIVKEIIVVDSSSDKTPEIAKKMGATVIAEERKGYGRAYKTGFSNIPKDADVIVTLDADGTYPVDVIPKLVKMLEDENLDFISCARQYSGVMSAKHKLGNFILTITSNILFFNRIADSQTGMWVFRPSVLDKIDVKSDGMPFSEEIKIRVIRAGLKFREIPVSYGERIGEVKLDSFRDGFKNLFYLFRLRFGL